MLFKSVKNTGHLFLQESCFLLCGERSVRIPTTVLIRCIGRRKAGSREEPSIYVKCLTGSTKALTNGFLYPIMRMKIA